MEIVHYSEKLKQNVFSFTDACFPELGYIFIRSKSVIYPMIMHSMSNVISVGGCYLYMVLFK